MRSSLALALFALTGAFPSLGSAFQAPRRTVLAVVRDVRTGEPIRDAPVKWLGATATARTDENGQALLVDDTGEREMRVWTAPDHYTEDVRTMRWMQGWNAVELWVQPTFVDVSPLIPSSVGGTHEFHTGGSGVDGADIEVRIRPGTFSRQVTIGFAAFPSWAMEVDESRELPLLLGQLSVLDERGAVLDIPAAHPIGLRISLPYQKEDDKAGFWTIPSQLDPATKRRTWCGGTAVPGAGRMHLEFDLEAGGSGRMPVFVSQYVRDLRTAHLPEITVDVERTHCVPIARRTISCGRLGAETPLSATDPAVVVIDPDVGRDLARALPGAPRIALGLAAGRVGLDVSMAIDGSLSATTIAKFPGVWNESALSPGPCFNGTADSMVVRAVYAVKVDGKKIGTITKPIATYVRRSLVHDPSCGEDCATPAEPPVDAWAPCR